MDKIRQDLICEHCNNAESTYLIFYRKYYPESGRYALINPKTVCSHCIELFRDSKLLFNEQPVIVPFDILATWDNRLQGLTSKKNFEFTIFNNPYWRKKLHRIRYIWQTPKK